MGICNEVGYSSELPVWCKMSQHTAGHCTRWSLKIPSNPNHPVTLGFFVPFYFPVTVLGSSLPTEPVSPCPAPGHCMSESTTLTEASRGFFY